MTLDANLLVGGVFILLIALTLIVMLADAFELRESMKDYCADVLTWCRTWTVRKFVLELGMACIALGQRLMDWAQRPEVPSGAKLTVSVRKEWEARSPVEMTRDAEGVVVWAGGRFLRIRQ